MTIYSLTEFWAKPSPTAVVTEGTLGVFLIDGSRAFRAGAPVISIHLGAGNAGMLQQSVADGDLARQLLWDAAWSGAMCEQSAPA